MEFCLADGGFAMITGDPGCGKSAAIRILASRLAMRPDLLVGLIERPVGKSSDFYRELASMFEVPLPNHNAWGGFKALRVRWSEHIASTLHRPVLIIDEAQEMVPSVLTELRLLVSKDLDARSLLTVVFVSDGRLPDRFRTPELLPLGSRIRRRLKLEPPHARSSSPVSTTSSSPPCPPAHVDRAPVRQERGRPIGGIVRLSAKAGEAQSDDLIHHSDRGVQYLSIRYTERLAEAGIKASVGSVGDSYDNALAESVMGLFETEVIRRRGPWRGIEDVELATLEWVDWFNNRRILELIGYLSPVEFETSYYRQMITPAIEAGLM